MLFDALDRQLQRDAQIPHAYYEILVRLSEAPDRSLRMSELADLTLSSRSRLSHAVARLEERGWIVRESCPTDRRGQLAHLTDAGYAVLADAAPGHVRSVREFVVDALSPEQLRAARRHRARRSWPGWPRRPDRPPGPTGPTSWRPAGPARSAGSSPR